MKAEELLLRDYIDKIYHFNVPRYQRTYSWSKEQCELLWQDLLQAGENDKKHFLGCIITVNKGTAIDQPVLIIDGQQRILTTMLLLEAMARSIDANEKSFGEVKSSSLRRIMCNKDDEGTAAPKISLSGDDRKHFSELIDGDRSESGLQSNIIKNFDFFSEEISKLSDKAAANLHEGLLKLEVVSIKLNENHDNPQQVFEDMNFKGKGLGASDLVRNHMLMDLSLEEQETLHNKFLLPMETCLHVGQKNWLEDFLFDYLVVKKAQSVGQKGKAQRIYNEFRTFRKEVHFSREELLKDMKTHSGFYADIVDFSRVPPPLRPALEDWISLSKQGPSQIMLALYASFKEGCFDVNQFVRIIRLLESYFFRRQMCDLPQKARHDTFLALIQKIKNNEIGRNSYLSGISKYFRELGAGKDRFPQDEEFKASLLKKDIYSTGKGGYHKYVLSKLENYAHSKERFSPLSLTVEHIMPRKLTPEWERDLGKGYAEVHENYLHKLGNLTSTGYNPELGRMTFIEKRDKPEIGFKASPLWLNQPLGKTKTWGKKQIEDRGKYLAERATKVWGLPKSSK